MLRTPPRSSHQPPVPDRVRTVNSSISRLVTSLRRQSTTAPMSRFRNCAARPLTRHAYSRPRPPTQTRRGPIVQFRNCRQRTADARRFSVKPPTGHWRSAGERGTAAKRGRSDRWNAENRSMASLGRGTTGPAVGRRFRRDWRFGAGSGDRTRIPGLGSLCPAIGRYPQVVS